MGNKYIDNLNDKYLDVLKKIHDNSIDVGVPIIKDEGLDLLLTLIKIIKPKRILEIGTAVAFSSIMMALNSDALIDTVERNKIMYQKAIENINLMSLNNRITVHYCDAVTLDINTLNNCYDLIFIDAAKAQNQIFFEKYSPLLSDKGIIVTDNILFHGYVERYSNQDPMLDVSKDLRALARKIDRFNNYLKNNKDYNSYFLACGDGMAISMKKESDL